MSPAERRKKAAYDARTEAKAQTVAVRRYLTALRERADVDAGPSADELEFQLVACQMERTIGPVPVIRELELHQQELDLKAAIAHRRSLNERIDIGLLEEEFIRQAPAFAGRKGVTRQAWTKMGVPTRVLEEAGL